MVSNDPLRDYMQRHDCSFPEALEALIAQLPRPPYGMSGALCKRWG
jgi:hypothetical protein